MSKYTDEERDAIVATSAALLQQRDQPSAPIEPDPDELLAEALALPLPDPIELWRCEGEAQELAFARARRERQRQQRPAPVDVELSISKAILAERERVYEVLGLTLGEMWAEQRKDAADQLADEVRTLRHELLDLQSTLLELRQLIASSDSSKTIDLPVLPLRGSRAH